MKMCRVREGGDGGVDFGRMNSSVVRGGGKERRDQAGAAQLRTDPSFVLIAFNIWSVYFWDDYNYNLRFLCPNGLCGVELYEFLDLSLRNPTWWWKQAENRRQWKGRMVNFHHCHLFLHRSQVSGFSFPALLAVDSWHRCNHASWASFSNQSTYSC